MVQGPFFRRGPDECCLRQRIASGPAWEDLSRGEFVVSGNNPETPGTPARHLPARGGRRRSAGRGQVDQGEPGLRIMAFADRKSVVEGKEVEYGCCSTK